MRKGSLTRGKSPAAVLAKGVLLACAVTLVGAVVLAKLLDMQVLQMDALGYGAMIAVAASGWAGAYRVLRGLDWNPLLSAAAGAGGYFVMLLLVNALFFGGEYPGFWSALAVTTLGAGLAVLTAGKGRRRANRGRYKIPGV